MNTNKQIEIKRLELVNEVSETALTVFNQHLAGKSGKDLLIATLGLSTCLGVFLKDIPTLVAQEMAETLGEFAARSIQAMARKLADENKDSKEQ